MGMTKDHEVRQITRRQVLLLGLGGLGSVALVACGQQPATTAPEPTAASQAEPTSAGAASGDATAPAQATGQIDFLAWGDAADIPAWEALVAQYREQNPGVTVNLTVVPEPNNNFYTRLQTLIAGGTPPDLASFQGWEWQTYADRGVLAPVDDLVARDNLAAIYPEGIQSVEVNTRFADQRYLVPLQIATMVLFYSKKLFDEAGVAYPTDDWTYEQFLEAATQLTDTSGEQKRFGYQPNGSWFRDIIWIRSTGKQEFDSIVDPRTAQFNQPEIAAIVQQVAQDFQYQRKISPTVADLEGGANTIVTGNSAMVYEGPWFLSRLNSPELRAEGKEVPFDVVLMPQGTDSNRPHRGWSEGVALLNGDNVEAAWGFASFIAGEEGQKTYSTTTGRIPNTLELAESFWLPTVAERFQVTNGQAFLEAFKRSVGDVISGVPRSKMWAEVVKPVGWDPLLANQAKASDVLPQVDAGLQALLDEYWAGR
jgi:multiple sugar transport system substrate-binding protein